MRKIAIIPARGGSKRIPNKNIKDVFGKPVISYAIETAIKSNLFDEIMVSTDSEEIKKISILSGASVPFMRSKINSTDNSTIYDVIVEVVKEYSKKNINFDYGCCIFPISPLINCEILNKCYQILTNGKYHSVLPLSYTEQPIERALKLDKRNLLKLDNLDVFKKMGQDFEPSYFDTGQFCWFNIKQTISTGSLISSKTKGMILNQFEYQDVNTFDEWEMLKIKYKYMLNKNDKET